MGSNTPERDDDFRLESVLISPLKQKPGNPGITRIKRVFLSIQSQAEGEAEIAGALASFSQALELQPENAEVHYNIGIIHYQHDRVDEAIQHFTAAKGINPTFAAAYYQVGLALLKKGEMEAAVENLEKYLSLAPDSPQSAQVRALLETLKKRS